MYLKFLGKGGDGSKRAGGDLAGVRLLRRLFVSADDEERCGGRGGGLEGERIARLGSLRAAVQGMQRHALAW